MRTVPGWQRDHLMDRLRAELEMQSIDLAVVDAAADGAAAPHADAVEADQVEMQSQPDFLNDQGDENESRSDVDAEQARRAKLATLVAWLSGETPEQAGRVLAALPRGRALAAVAQMQEPQRSAFAAAMSREVTGNAGQAEDLATADNWSRLMSISRSTAIAVCDVVGDTTVVLALKGAPTQVRESVLAKIGEERRSVYVEALSMVGHVAADEIARARVAMLDAADVCEIEASRT